MINEMGSQIDVCKKWGSPYCPIDPFLKVGISNNVDGSVYPINGLRHSPKGDTSGWYIWAGDCIREEDDFFLPLHAIHISDWCPEVEKYLALSPGWRFLIAPGYEDVWFDASLLDN